MLWNTAAFTGALLATARACSAAEIRALALDERYIVGSADVMERRYEDVANRYMEKRQTTAPNTANKPLAAPSSDVVLNPDGTLNMTAWDEQTSIACTEALSHLDIASNPSGTCICYNLPSLDTTTGVFEADLRLFKISEPTGRFATIPPQNIQVGLSYSGASVSPVRASRIQSTERVGSRSLQLEADLGPLHERDITLQLLQAYLFVGQIDKAKMKTGMTMYVDDGPQSPFHCASANSVLGLNSRLSSCRSSL